MSWMCSEVRAPKLYHLSSKRKNLKIRQKKTYKR